MALGPQPMPGAPGGAPPGPPGGTGAATVSAPMPGMTNQGMAGVKTAVEMLQKSIVQLPMGSPIHTKALKFIAEVSKEIGQDGGGEGGGDDVKQQIAQMARQRPNPQAQAAMQKLFPPPAQPGGAAPMAA
jgi:hypothetical protein